MKIFNLIVASIISFNAYAEVPNTFTSGTKAKASEVNENFESIDNRVTALEDVPVEEVVAIAEGHNLASNYVAKTANIGDVVATISGTTYVLGAIPFREYKTGVIYKVIMPLKRYDCSRTVTTTDSSGSENIYNYQCADGQQYYYEQSLRVSHHKFIYDNVYKFNISGYSAFFAYSWGEQVSISLTNNKQDTRTSIDSSSEFDKYYYDRVVTPLIKVGSYSNDLGLNVQIKETLVYIYYGQPMREEFEKEASSEAGPDFTLGLTNDELNDHIDLTEANLRKDLYNYIRIEAL